MGLELLLSLSKYTTIWSIDKLLWLNYLLKVSMISAERSTVEILVKPNPQSDTSLVIAYKAGTEAGISFRTEMLRNEHLAKQQLIDHLLEAIRQGDGSLDGVCGIAGNGLSVEIANSLKLPHLQTDLRDHDLSDLTKPPENLDVKNGVIIAAYIKDGEDILQAAKNIRLLGFNATRAVCVIDYQYPFVEAKLRAEGIGLKCLANYLSIITHPQFVSRNPDYLNILHRTYQVQAGLLID